MADYFNSAYTGPQIDGAVGAVIEKQEVWDNKVSAVAITIPKGRVKGDVNGDGAWTSLDKSAIIKIFVGSTTPTDIEKWCGDINEDGAVDSSDQLAIQEILKGTYDDWSLITDYYGNWSYDSDSMNWSTDIVAPNINTGTDLILNIFDVNAYENFIKAEITDTGIKIYMDMPPVDDVLCMGEVSAGSGRVIANGRTESEIFVAAYDTTSYKTLAAAYAAGKVLFCTRAGSKTNYVPLMTYTKSSEGFTFGPDYYGFTLSCSKSSEWSRTKWGGGKLPSVTTTDDGKFLRVVDGAWAAAEAQTGAQITSGTYTGTGTNGSSAPTTLNLPFQPKVLFIDCDSDMCAQARLFVYGAPKGLTRVTDNSVYYATMTWNGTQVSWYSADHAIYQLNGQGYTYRYVAIA